MVADHLLRVSKEEGISLDEQAASALARQAEGSFRDALSLLDQASVLGAGEVGEEAVAVLLGAPRGEIQHELADAIAVRDTRSVFAVVDRLVQEGQDLRHVTAEVLKHFRNLLLVQTAPDQADVVDVAPDEYERLRAQAAKFSSAELSRTIALLLAAQTDMRWTTSPRLTLELALVRASMPEADPEPHALIARIERLERLAGIEQSAGAAEPLSPAGSPESVSSASIVEGTEAAAVPGGRDPSADGRDPARQQAAADDAEPPSPPSTGEVDIDMLRRSWATVVDRLKSARQMILFSNLQSVTPVSYDGDTLELAFPPNRSFGVEKVEQRLPKVQEVLQEMFGVSPRIRCVVREPVAGTTVTEETPPPSEEAALARLKAELDAQITDPES
jgi:DNA polymerase-3 subunit gamma/tau